MKSPTFLKLLIAVIKISFFSAEYRNFNRELGADVAKWIKAVDCESAMRGFKPRHSPSNKSTLSLDKMTNLRTICFCKSSRMASTSKPHLKNLRGIAYLLQVKMEWPLIHCMKFYLIFSPGLSVPKELRLKKIRPFFV